VSGRTKLVKSVHFNRRDDADILRKLRRAGKFDTGEWSPFVRELCRRWAEGEPLNGHANGNGAGPAVAAGDIIQAVTQALDERQLSLAGVRQVVESTLGSVTPVVAGEPESEAVEENWFDALDEGAIL